MKSSELIERLDAHKEIHDIATISIDWTMDKDQRVIIVTTEGRIIELLATH